MTVSYSQERPCEVLRVYKRTGSVSKTILLLGSRAVPAYCACNVASQHTPTWC